MATLIEAFDCQMPFPIDLRFVKADINGRNAIPVNARYVGLLCFTVSEALLWVLNGPDKSDNANWKQVWPTVAPEAQVFLNPSAPSDITGNDGDIYFQTGLGDGTHVWQKSGGTWTDLGSLGGAPYTPPKSRIPTTSGTPLVITWTDEAPDETGNPSGQTYAERYGNNFTWSAYWDDSGIERSYAVGIAIARTGSDIDAVEITETFDGYIVIM